MLRPSALLAACCMLAPGCGSEDGPSFANTAADDPTMRAAGVSPDTRVELHATRQDGTTFEVRGDAVAWCAAEEADYWSGPSLSVSLRLGRDLERQPVADVEVAADTLAVEGVVAFPVDGLQSDEPVAEGATAFITDPGAPGDEPDELSSDDERTRGELVVTRPAACREGEPYELELDATLESEVSDRTVDVTGTITGTIGATPDWDAVERALADEAG